MKNFLKHFLTKTNLLVIAIFIVALGVRFYNFDTRVVYGPEQAISLISAMENLQKPSLLGIPYLIRQTSTGLNLFTSPVFGYSLIPLVIVFNYDVFKITAFFTVLNIITGLALFFVVKSIFDNKIAIISSVIFLFSDYMIYHSLFIWTSNYMPAVGVATIYLLFRFIKDKKRRLLWVLLLGFICGLGFGIEYIFLFGAVIVFGLILKYSGRRVIDSLLFIVGAAVGELPTLVFDLKHGFYHVRTLFSYFLDTLNSPEQSQISYYHFLVLWPLGAILLGILITKIFNRNKFISTAVLLIFVYLNLISPRISFTKSVGMPDGLTAGDILKAAKIISREGGNNFNVSVPMGFDNRGYVLRFPLKYIYHKEPLSVENYPNADLIYILSNKNYNFTDPDIWEIRSYQPYKTAFIEDINKDYGIYKLTK